jgi:hypothetical protein
MSEGKSKEYAKLETRSYARDILEDMEYDTHQFIKAFSPISLATHPLEALFIEYVSYLWSAKRKKPDGSSSYVFRKDEKGVWINQRHFTNCTGISRATFWRIVRKYEDEEILVTETVKDEGNRKYYRLAVKRLQSYIRERLGKLQERRSTSRPWTRWDDEDMEE